MTTGSRFALAMLMAALSPAMAQAAAGADAGNRLVGFNALKLTAAQQRGVYQAIGDVPELPPPPHYLIHVGGKVPESIPVKPLPVAATRQAPLLAHDGYVKLAQGDVLLVKPSDRTIVEVIDRYHGTVAAQDGQEPVD